MYFKSILFLLEFYILSTDGVESMYEKMQLISGRKVAITLNPVKNTNMKPIFINLCHNKDNKPFMLTFKGNDQVVTFGKMANGKAEDHKALDKVPISENLLSDNVKLEIVKTPTSYAVYVNGDVLGSTKHGTEDQIEGLEIEGSFETKPVLSVSEASTDELQTSKYKLTNFPIRKGIIEKYDATDEKNKLGIDLQVGKMISIKGTIKDNANNFSINLYDENFDVALHFQPRLNKDLVRVVSKYNNEWNCRPGLKIPANMFKTNESFEISIRNTEASFKIFVNHKLFTSFTHLKPELRNKIIALKVYGDMEFNEYFTISDFSAEGSEKYSFSSNQKNIGYDKQRKKHTYAFYGIDLTSGKFLTIGLNLGENIKQYQFELLYENFTIAIHGTFQIDKKILTLNDAHKIVTLVASVPNYFLLSNGHIQLGLLNTKASFHIFLNSQYLLKYKRPSHAETNTTLSLKLFGDGKVNDDFQIDKFESYKNKDGNDLVKSLSEKINEQSYISSVKLTTGTNIKIRGTVLKDAKEFSVQLFNNEFQRLYSFEFESPKKMVKILCKYPSQEFKEESNHFNETQKFSITIFNNEKHFETVINSVQSLKNLAHWPGIDSKAIIVKISGDFVIDNIYKDSLTNENTHIQEEIPVKTIMVKQSSFLKAIEPHPIKATYKNFGMNLPKKSSIIMKGYILPDAEQFTIELFDNKFNMPYHFESLLTEETVEVYGEYKGVKHVDEISRFATHILKRSAMFELEIIAEENQFVAKMTVNSTTAITAQLSCNNCTSEQHIVAVKVYGDVIMNEEFIIKDNDNETKLLFDMDDGIEEHEHKFLNFYSSDYTCNLKSHLNKLFNEKQYRKVVRHLNNLCSMGSSSCKLESNPGFNVYHHKDKLESELIHDRKSTPETDTLTDETSSPELFTVIHVAEENKTENVLIQDKIYHCSLKPGLVKMKVTLNQNIKVKLCAISASSDHELKCTNFVKNIEPESNIELTMDGLDESFKINLIVSSSKHDGLVIIHRIDFIDLFGFDIDFGFQTGHVQIMNRNKYLDVECFGILCYLVTRDHDQMNPNQWWFVEKISDSSFIISPSTYYDRAIDVNNALFYPLKELGLLKKDARPSQKFMFEKGMLKSEISTRLSFRETSRNFGFNSLTWKRTPFVLTNKQDDMENKVSIEKASGKYSQLWYFISTPNQAFESFGFDPQIRIKEFTARISPKDKNMNYKIKANQNAKQFLLYHNGKQVERKENATDFEVLRPLEGGIYKFDFGGSVIIMDLTQMNVNALDSEISEITLYADLTKRESSIVYKLETFDLSIKCAQNFQSMSLSYYNITSTGGGVKFKGVIEPINTYKCGYGKGKHFSLSFQVRDVLPRISEYQISYAPAFNLTTVTCVGISDLTSSNPIQSNITLYLDTVEVDNRVHATRLVYGTYVEKRSINTFKCVIKNRFGSDEKTLAFHDNLKDETIGLDGSVVSLKVNPYSGKGQIFTNFGPDRSLPCEKNYEPLSFNSKVDEDKEIIRYPTSFSDRDAFTCSSNRDLFYARFEALPNDLKFR